MNRPWLRFYHERTAQQLPPVPWPHLPAFIRDAAATYRENPAFTLFLPNGTQGTITYGEIDRLSDEFAVYLREVVGLKARRPRRVADAELPGLSGGGVWLPQSRPRDGQHQPALHRGGDDPPIHRQRRRRRSSRSTSSPPRSPRCCREPVSATVMLVSIPDLLPPLKRFVVRAVQKYVKKMIPPVTFAHVTFPARACRKEQARIAQGADVSGYATTLSLESIAALQYTGGTTGVSKGAVLTHGNLLANVTASLEAWKPFLEYGREVMLTALPLYHIFAFTANLMLFFVVGGRNILIPSPRPFTNMKLAFERERITWFTGINTLFIALMNEPWFQAKKDWALKGTVAGGMALAPAVGERWQEMTGTPIFQGYGLTETSPVVTLVPFHRAKLASIGVPIPGTDVRLVDDQRRRRASGPARRVDRPRPAGDAGLLAAP